MYSKKHKKAYLQNAAIVLQIRPNVVQIIQRRTTRRKVMSGISDPIGFRWQRSRRLTAAEFEIKSPYGLSADSILLLLPPRRFANTSA